VEVRRVESRGGVQKRAALRDPRPRLDEQADKRDVALS